MSQITFPGLVLPRRSRAGLCTSRLVAAVPSLVWINAATSSQTSVI